MGEVIFFENLRKTASPPARNKERLGSKPKARSNGDIVSPCTTTEKATTPNVAITISLRRASDGGSANASARANAPRSPPHHRRCCAGRGIAHRDQANIRQSG